MNGKGKSGDATPNDDKDKVNQKNVNPSTADDLSRFRLNLNVMTGSVKKLLTMVPVRKPPAQSFIYVRPGNEWRLDSVALIELKEDREYFLVDPELTPLIDSEWQPFTLAVYALRGNSVALWPIRLPGSDGKDNDWWVSARDVVQHHAGKWIRVKANMEVGGYDVFQAQADLAEPEWPDVTFPKLLEIAFDQRKHRIDSEDHPVLLKLRGEM